MVIKIGSSSLVDDNGVLDLGKVDRLVKEISLLKQDEIMPILVSSGAIAVGRSMLNIKPQNIAEKQALAAVGQASLMHEYEVIFNRYDLKCAQILLNHDDFDVRKRVLNLETTINTLIDFGVIPIINENDALSVDEIKVGDNDTLSALISGIVDAKLLVLVSDIDGLFDKNPKIYNDAKLIKQVDVIDKNIINMATDSSTQFGTGGMITKIKAAKIATTAGVDMLIMNNDKLYNLHNVFNSFDGTLFKANEHKMNAKSHWVLYKTNPKGYIYVDNGAKKALCDRKSLLAVGITSVKGVFDINDVVGICNGKEMIAKGIVNYTSEQIDNIKGKTDIEVKQKLGNNAKNVVVHANNIVLLEEE
ncbi:MAG: glutamate 5-kinase [bacterium]|nr:glutamate 5-kinase [bacterium]